ncbi:MAG TPA: hypothetical protein VFR18_23950 [Terriglobia bacterium]|nr:hypothetical protein [Terriglobia bacterium]
MTDLKRAMLFLGVVAGLSQRAIGIDIREPGELMMISEYTEIGNAVRDLNQLSEVRKIIFVDALRDMLADNRQLRLEGYVFRAGEPDLRVVAGRAESFIDQVLLLPRGSRQFSAQNQRENRYVEGPYFVGPDVDDRADWKAKNKIRGENTHRYRP